MKKKLLAFTLCLGLILTTVGCGSKSSPSGSSSGNTSSTSESSSVSESSSAGETASSEEEKPTTEAASNSPITVGSKDFTESLVLAEIYALALEDAGYQVERADALASAVIRESIKTGDVDFYPEYTGTALVSVLGLDPVYDEDQVYQTVKEEYEKQYGISVLDPADVNDSEGLAMLATRAKELGITTISQAWAAAKNQKLVFSCKAEFTEAQFPRLEEVYGKLPFEVSVMEHTLSFSAAKSGDVDLFSVYTTEGNLVGDDYVVLEDDLGAWVPYYIVPVIRDDALQANPGAENVINQVTATFTTENVIAMNSAVDVDGEEYADVAKEYYESIKDSLDF